MAKRAISSDTTAILLAVIEAEARQLEAWASEAERGGWSTQHVHPMRNRASELWAVAGRVRAQ